VGPRAGLDVIEKRKILPLPVPKLITHRTNAMLYRCVSLRRTHGASLNKACYCHNGESTLQTFSTGKSITMHIGGGKWMRAKLYQVSLTFISNEINDRGNPLR
jgi:hypothetical protein